MARDEVQVDHLVFVYRVEIHFGVVGCLSTNDYSTRLFFLLSRAAVLCDSSCFDTSFGLLFLLLLF